MVIYQLILKMLFTVDFIPLTTAYPGDNGYITISRGLNVCRVSDYVYYPEVRNKDDPTDEPPTFVPTPAPG